MLEAMKEVYALDISGDGVISEPEFKRLYHPGVITAAQVKVRADALWLAQAQDSDGNVSRSKAWDVILGDSELALAVGKGDSAAGKALLKAMKEVRALDIRGENKLSKSNFSRLYNPAVLLAAGVKVWADAKWATLKKDKNGRVERLALWDIILADDEVAHLMGSENSANGKARLEAMKEVRALDISGDGQIAAAEFSRLYNPVVRQIKTPVIVAAVSL